MNTQKDINHSDIKIIQEDRWKFDFRENGYVIISICSINIDENNKEVIDWTMMFHGVDLHTCIAYIFKYYGENKIIHYEELEDVVVK